MVTINLLWPTWARIVAHLSWKVIQSRGYICARTVKKAAALLAARYGNEQDARFALLAWDKLLEEPMSKSERIARYRLLSRASKSGGFAIALAFLLALATPAAAEEREKEGRLFRALGWATFGACAGDVVSTELALAAGGFEGNPLQRHRAVRIASHVAYPVAMNRWTAELRREHPKAALWMRIGIVAGFGYLTAHNLRQAK